jgi:class 3 adenylate cyclase
MIMKRITYMSTYGRPLSDQEIQAIGKTSALNNQAKGITGVLVSIGGHFFQIIEGEEEAIDALFHTISHDPRHTGLLCLKTEFNISERLFPHWSMNTINLDQNTDSVLYPLKILFQTVGDTHRIIEHYTQPSVLRIIASGINPLSVPVRKVDKLILFTDIVSFSFLSNRYPVEEVSQVVNEVFDLCTAAIASQGGEVTKFMGDCVMAYFSTSQVDKALSASLTILEQLQTLRRTAQPGSLRSVLYCGIGLSWGTVIEGNIGSAQKMDYTIIGDPVNTAAQVESLTRELHKALAFTEDVKNQARQPWNFLSVGNVTLKGKEEVSQIFSLDNELVSDFSTHRHIQEQVQQFR